MRFDFPPFTLDDERHLLLKDAIEVHLSLKAYELLKLLLESSPRVVKRTVLYDRLWPDTFVTDATLRSVVAEVRAALGGKAGAARNIRTVQRVGYAFSGNVSARTEEAPVASPPVLYWLTLGSREFPLNPGENVIGRDTHATVRIDDGTVSRRHARIVIGAEGATLEDLKSRNGTWVGESRVIGPIALKDGDRLTLGAVSLILRSPDEPASTETFESANRVPDAEARRRPGDGRTARGASAGWRRRGAQRSGA